MFVPFAAGFFLSYLFRNANAVIARDLAAEFSLSPADVGLLTSMYLLSFAAMQVPVGVFLDRYGPRRVVASLLCIAALGALEFALASGFGELALGRGQWVRRRSPANVCDEIDQLCETYPQIERIQFIDHGFALDRSVFENKQFALTHVNLNDDTVEGFRHRDLPVISVQYHPEASPGPHDSHYLFEEFVSMMRARREGK